MTRRGDHSPRHFARPAEPDRRGGGQGRRSTDDGERRRNPWIVPALLALLAVTAGSGAALLDRGATAEAVGLDRAVSTPVLSVRRAPEVVAAPAADRRLDAELQAWLAASPADTCLVVDHHGRDVFAHNPTTPVTGASTQKLLTATGLLLALGPDATFRTDAVALAPPADGVIEGDLVVVGGGPADLGTPDWPEMSPGTRPRVVHDIDGLVTAIVDAGVTRIEGSVVGDGSRYDDDRYEDSLAQRLIDQDQVGPIGGLMVNDGFAAFSPERTNAATIPASDPAADAARVLTERLVAHDVTVVGAPRSGTAPDGAVTVASLDSPPLSQLVGEMLSTSDNEAAEAGLKEIGVATGGEGSWAAGATGLTALLGEAGVPLDAIEVVDGSGLTIENQLSCRALVDVLTLEGTGPVVRDGLAVAGETGTLAERWVDTPVAGRLRGKTGTLRNVTALAGEIEPVSGGALSFAYVANVPDPREVSPEQVGIDELATILVDYPEGIDMAALEPLPASPAT